MLRPLFVTTALFASTAASVLVLSVSAQTLENPRLAPPPQFEQPMFVAPPPASSSSQPSRGVPTNNEEAVTNPNSPNDPEFPPPASSSASSDPVTAPIGGSSTTKPPPESSAAASSSAQPANEPVTNVPSNDVSTASSSSSSLTDRNPEITPSSQATSSTSPVPAPSQGGTTGTASSRDIAASSRASSSSSLTRASSAAARSSVAPSSSVNNPSSKPAFQGAIIPIVPGTPESPASSSVSSDSSVSPVLSPVEGSESSSSFSSTPPEPAPEEPPHPSLFSRETFGYSIPIIDPNGIQPPSAALFARPTIFINLFLTLLFTIIVGISGLLFQQLFRINPERLRQVLGRLPFQGFLTLLLLWSIHLFIPQASAQGLAAVGSVSPQILLFYAVIFFTVVGTSNYLFNNIITSDGDKLHNRLVSHPLVMRCTGGRTQMCRETKLILLFLLLYGVIGAFINPSFSLIPAQQIGIVIISTLAILLSAYAKDSMRFLLTRAFRWEAWFKANVVGLFVAVLCIALSRSLSLSPGYIYGAPMGLFIVAAVYQKREGMFESMALVSVKLIALVVWLLLPLVSPHPVLLDLCNLIFVVIAEHAFFEMLPLPYLAGGSIFRWRKLIWAIQFACIVFLLCQTIFNPKGTIASIQQSPPALTAILLLGCYVVGVFLLWAYIVWGKKQQKIAV